MDSDKLYVVGIGASAGGLDAIQQLFDHIPSDTGIAYVIVQHLSPDFKSLMPELLPSIPKCKFLPPKTNRKYNPTAFTLISAIKTCT
jgi:two-component system CheB/CheR fusion protein